MADEMMRTAVRSHTGVARPWKGDNEGNASVMSPTKLVHYALTNDAIVPAGGSVALNLNTSFSTVGEIINVSINAPAIAGATGDHRFTAGWVSVSAENRILDITSQASQAISVINGWNKGASTSIIPADDMTRLFLFSNLWADELTNDFQVVYINSSDIDVPVGQLDVEFQVLETRVTPQ